MKRFEQTRSKPAIQIAIWVTAALVCVADVLTPLGIAVWIFYLVPLVLCLYEWRPRVPLLVASVGTLFIFITYFVNARISGFPARIAQFNRTLGVFTIWCSAFVVRQFIVAKLNLRQQDWIRSGQNDLSARMQGEQDLDQLGDNILTFLCQYLQVPVATLYVRERDGHFRRRASYGLGSTQPTALEVLTPGDSLLGQAIKDKRIIRFDDLPSDYLPVSPCDRVVAART